MANIERPANKLILKSGVTTLALDKSVGNAALQRKLLLWHKKPVPFAFQSTISLKGSTQNLQLSTKITPSIGT